MAKWFVFDIDGTLATSKRPIDEEMRYLLSVVARHNNIVLLTGGNAEQVESQVLNLVCYKEAYGLPTSGAQHIRYGQVGPKVIWNDFLSEEQVDSIYEAFAHTFHDIKYEHPREVYGAILENRVSQVTFSACGQAAPVEVKKLWDPTQDKRKEIVAILSRYLPNFECRIGGTTSIDVTIKGQDKGTNLRRFMNYYGIRDNELLYFGDAFGSGGNDLPVLLHGIPCVMVADPQDCKRKIRIHAGSVRNRS